MPGYEFRCDNKHRLVVTYPIGTAPRQLDCLACSKPMKLVIGAGVNVAPSALETKGANVRDLNGREPDFDAYARMRARGLQPESIFGCAELENKVEDQMDIKYGDLYDKIPKETIKEGLEHAALHRAGIDL